MTQKSINFDSNIQFDIPKVEGSLSVDSSELIDGYRLKLGTEVRLEKLTKMVVTHKEPLLSASKDRIDMTNVANRKELDQLGYELMSTILEGAKKDRFYFPFLNLKEMTNPDHLIRELSLRLCRLVGSFSENVPEVSFGEPEEIEINEPNIPLAPQSITKEKSIIGVQHRFDDKEDLKGSRRMAIRNAGTELVTALIKLQSELGTLQDDYEGRVPVITPIANYETYSTDSKYPDHGIVSQIDVRVGVFGLTSGFPARVDSDPEEFLRKKLVN